MDEQTFFRLGLAAKSLQEKATDESEQKFWEGYRRGLRRKYHGERFGTDDEHAEWMSFADELSDLSRRLRGIGYRAGFEEMEISQAIEHLKRLMLPH